LLIDVVMQMNCLYVINATLEH